MKNLTLVSLTITALIFLSSSCHKESQPAPNDIEEAVKVIQNYADSFEGLTVSEAKNRVNSSTMNEEVWDEEGIVDGKMISAQYDGYSLLLMCHDGAVVTASVQFLSVDN